MQTLDPAGSFSVPHERMIGITLRRDTIAAAVRPTLLRDPEARFGRKVDRHSFQFTHGLAHHPMFELPELLALAQRHPRTPGSLYWSGAVDGVGGKWREGEGSVTEALARIAENNSIVQFRYVEQDPVMGPRIRELMAGIVSLSGTRLREDLVDADATLLIASPRRITHFHADAACGFLVQIAGSGKTLSVFERGDHGAAADEELERFYCGDFNGLEFHEDQRRRATCYEVKAGQGVHIPCVAPHWAHNGADVSVALSLSFHLRSDQRRGDIYRVNRRLRGLGLSPVPPEVSPWRDRLKLAARESLGALRRLGASATRH